MIHLRQGKHGEKGVWIDTVVTDLYGSWKVPMMTCPTCACLFSLGARGVTEAGVVIGVVCCPWVCGFAADVLLEGWIPNPPVAPEVPPAEPFVG